MGVVEVATFLKRSNVLGNFEQLVDSATQWRNREFNKAELSLPWSQLTFSSESKTLVFLKTSASTLEDLEASLFSLSCRWRHHGGISRDMSPTSPRYQFSNASKFKEKISLLG